MRESDALLKKEKDTSSPSPRTIRKRVPSLLYSVLLLIILAFLFTLGNRNFLTAYNLNNVITYSAVLMVVALGQMATILVGGIDLSVGGIMSFVSVLFVVLLKGIGSWAYPICIAAGALTGYVNGNLLTRIRIPSFIATLGTGGILASMALIVSPRPIDAPSKTYPLLDIVNGSYIGINNVIFWAVVILALAYILLRFTKTGRNIFYVGSNIKMSWMSGINIVNVRNAAFMMSGVGASFAGIMLSCQHYGGDPTLGSVYVLTSIAAVVVGGTALTGGTGGAINTLIGAVILGVLENGMNVVGVNVFFQQSILGLMIIVSVALTFERSKTPIIK